MVAPARIMFPIMAFTSLCLVTSTSAAAQSFDGLAYVPIITHPSQTVNTGYLRELRAGLEAAGLFAREDEPNHWNTPKPPQPPPPPPTTNPNYTTQYIILPDPKPYFRSTPIHSVLGFCLTLLRTHWSSTSLPGKIIGHTTSSKWASIELKKICKCLGLEKMSQVICVPRYHKAFEGLVDTEPYVTEFNVDKGKN